MTRPKTASTLAAALVLLALPAGCVSQRDVDDAVGDELRFSGRVMGFALDAHQETLRMQLALLDSFQGDPRLAELEKHLGTRAEIETKLERVATSRRTLIEENQRLRARHQLPETGEPPEER